jgi:hypothetical protein
VIGRGTGFPITQNSTVPEQILILRKINGETNALCANNPQVCQGFSRSHNVQCDPAIHEPEPLVCPTHIQNLPLILFLIAGDRFLDGLPGIRGRSQL